MANKTETHIFSDYRWIGGDGDVITVQRQFDTNQRYGIETIEFADGETLIRSDLRHTMLEQAKAMLVCYREGSFPRL